MPKYEVLRGFTLYRDNSDPEFVGASHYIHISSTGDFFVEVTYHGEKFKARKYYVEKLIASGRIVLSEGDDSNNTVAVEPCPKNNDGRTTCAWCGAPTRKAGDGAYDICTKCGR